MGERKKKKTIDDIILHHAIAKRGPV